MSLDGAKFVCLGVEAGGTGSIQTTEVAEGEAADVRDDGPCVLEAKGRKFTVGYYMSCDCVLVDQRAKGVHCEIQCDAFGRVTIHNLSEEHPISVNGQIIEMKRPLLHGSRIKILDKEYLWQFPLAESSTPEKSEAVPEQPPNSCPDLRLRWIVPKRLTVHKFAYCIQSDEEGNSSQEASQIANAADETETTIEKKISAEEKSNLVKLKEDKDTIEQGLKTPNLPPTAMEPKTGAAANDEKPSGTRCVTPEALVSESRFIDVLETPTMSMINCTQNKENKSTEKKRQVLSLCNRSDVVITSFSPRETGVRIEKSFTAVLKPTAMTPKSVYSTPKSVLSEYNDDCSHDFIDFSTPATSKKTLTRCLAKNSSMHLIDLTTPTKLRPESPQPKIALKSCGKRLPEREAEEASRIRKGPTSQEEGIIPLSASPIISSIQAETPEFVPSSAESVISVDGSTTSSNIIDVSSEDSTPGPSSITQVSKTPRQTGKIKKANTPLRTPQSLMKRAILTSAKKQVTASRMATAGASTSQKFTTARSNTSQLQSVAGTSSPITPRSVSASTKAALALKQRQSLSAPSRRSLITQKSKLERSPCANLSTIEPRALTTSTPMHSRMSASSSSVMAKWRKASPLHGVRKSVGNNTLLSHISKARKSIALADQRTPPSVSAQLVARARKSLSGAKKLCNERARNLVAAAVALNTSKIATSEATNEELNTSKVDSNDLSRTFIVDDSFAEEAPVRIDALEEDKKPKDTTSSYKENLTNTDIVKHELNRTFSAESLSKVVDEVVETPIDAVEVNSSSTNIASVTDTVATEIGKSVEVLDELADGQKICMDAIPENFAELVEMPSVTVDGKDDENSSSAVTVTELLEAALKSDAVAMDESELVAEEIEEVIAEMGMEIPHTTTTESVACDGSNEAIEEVVSDKAERNTVDSTTTEANILENECGSNASNTNLKDNELEAKVSDTKSTVSRDADVCSPSSTVPAECIKENAFHEKVTVVEEETFQNVKEVSLSTAVTEDSIENKTEIVAEIPTVDIRCVDKHSASTASVQSNEINLPSRAVDAAFSQIDGTPKEQEMVDDVEPTSTEESDALLDEIDYVLNKSDELHQKQIEKEGATEVLSDELESSSSHSQTQESEKAIRENNEEIDKISVEETENKPIANGEKAKVKSVLIEMATKHETVSNIQTSVATGTVLNAENISATSAKAIENRIDIPTDTDRKKSIERISQEDTLKCPIEIASTPATKETEKEICTTMTDGVSTEKASESPKDIALAEDESGIVTSTADEKENQITFPKSTINAIMETEPKKMQTPDSPHLSGIREMLRTPKCSDTNTPRFIGIRNLMRTPKLTKCDMGNDNETENLEGLQTMLQTPHHSRKLDAATVSTPQMESVAILTPRRSTRRRASATADMTPTYSENTPRRSARRRASESAEPLSASLSSFTPKRISTRRPSLSLDDDVATPKKRCTRVKRLAAFEENAEDMGAIIEEESKDVLDKATEAKEAVIESSVKCSTLNETTKINEPNEQDIERKTVNSVNEIIDEIICEELQHDHQNTSVDQGTKQVEQVKKDEIIMEREMPVCETEIPENDDIGLCTDEDPNLTVGKHSPVVRKDIRLDNSPRGILDESDYEYGKEVTATKEMNCEPLQAEEATNIPQTPKSQKTVKFEESSTKTPVMTGIREMLKTPKVAASTSKLVGVRELMRTPKTSTHIDNEGDVLEGLSELVKTPKTEVKLKDEEEVTETREMDSEPLQVEETSNIASAVVNPHTPKSHKTVKFEASSPKTPVMSGMREMLKTPKAAASTPNLDGVRELVCTPKASARTVNDSDDFQELSEVGKTPKAEIKCKDEEESPSTSAEARLTYLGMREMLQTPKFSSTPLLKGVREMLKTPKSCNTPKLGGLKELLETPIQSIDRTEEDRSLKQEVTVASMTKDLNETEGEGLNKFFKTPRAKDMMIPNVPPSAVIEKTADCVELVTDTEYELNFTASNLEDIFKTPVSTRFAKRIKDSCGEDSKVEEKEHLEESSVKEVESSVTPVKPVKDCNEVNARSAEEAFDELVGQTTNLCKTPCKVYSRKSSTSAVQPSPFSASDVISDLPKTDIQEWVDSLEAGEQSEEEMCGVELEESEISVSVSMVEQNASNRTHDPIADSALEHSKATERATETMINVSVASSAVDPLLASVCKTGEVNALETIDEGIPEHAATPVGSEISGINLLDQTSESIFSEALVLSDSDSVDKNEKEDEKITSKDMEGTIHHEMKMEENVAEKVVEKESEENVKKLHKEDKKDLESMKSLEDISEEKEDFPVMLIDSDTDSDEIIEETPAKSKIIAKGRSIPSALQKPDDNEFAGAVTALSGTKTEMEIVSGEILKAEFTNFQENAVLMRQRCLTPDQHKARAKLSRKTLGAEDDVKITLGLELEKADLEKAKLIEACANETVDKESSVICVEGNAEGEITAVEDVCLSNDNVEIGETKSIDAAANQVFDEEDSVICIEEKSDAEEEKADVLEETLPKDKPDLEEGKLMQTTNETAVKEKTDVGADKTMAIDVSFQKEVENVELTDASADQPVNEEKDMEVICDEEKTDVEVTKTGVNDFVTKDEVIDGKEIAYDVVSNMEVPTTADGGATDVSIDSETVCVIVEKAVRTKLNVQSTEESSEQNRAAVGQEELFEKVKIEVSAAATPVEVTEAVIENPTQIIEDISIEGAAEDAEIVLEVEKDPVEKIEIGVSTVLEELSVEDDHVSSSALNKNEVAEHADCVARAPEIERENDVFELAENNLDETIVTEITQEKELAVDKEENIANNMEQIVDVKMQITVNDNKESIGTEKKTTESKAETTEMPAKRRTRKGSRATKQSSTNDEPSTTGVIAETTEESGEVIISTDYEIKIRDAAKTEDENLKPKEIEVNKTIVISVKESEVAESGHEHVEDAIENIQVLSEPLEAELGQPTESNEEQITTAHSSITQADTKSVKVLVESQITVREGENVEASIPLLPVESEATTVIKDESKVRKRTRKGSQSSQCSTHEESEVLPKRRGGRRRANTPTEPISESLNSSEAMETVMSETIGKRRYSDKKAETVLEEVREVVTETENNVLDTIQEPTALVNKEEAQTIAEITSAELDHLGKALNTETCAVAVEPSVANEIKAVANEVDVTFMGTSVPEMKNVANEEHVVVEENKEETLVETEARQKRIRRKAQNTNVTQNSSSIDDNEVSTSRRRRGRKNTEDSNPAKMNTGVMESQIVKDSTKVTINTLADYEKQVETAETSDAATGANLAASEINIHNDELKSNESENPESVVEAEEEVHSTQVISKRQVRGKRNRKVSANKNEEDEMLASIKLQNIEEATSSAKKPVGRARTTRRRHPEIITTEEEITDSHEDKDDSLQKQTEEDVEEDNLKTEISEETEIAATRRRGVQKAHQHVEAVVAPKRRGGKRKQDEPSAHVVVEHITAHDDVTANNPTKSTRRKKVQAELVKLETELHDAPGDDETEDDHDVTQKGTRKRRGAAASTVAPKRAVRGRTKRNQHEDEMKTLEGNLSHTVQSEFEVLHTESAVENAEVAKESIAPTKIQKTESKSRLRKRNESQAEEDYGPIAEQAKPSAKAHVEIDTVLNDEQTERERGESHIDYPEEQTQIEEDVKPKMTEYKAQTKPKGRKRRESHIEQQKSEASSDEPPHKRDAVTVLQADSKAETPQHVKAAPLRTRKASTLIDSSHHSSHESDLSTGTPQRVRSRNVPRRSATAQDHNYDESSDTEAQAEFKRRLERREYVVEKDISTAEKPTTSRGRTRKPTAKVQEYLEKERVKAGTPKRRLLLTGRTETPTSESHQEPSRRGRKASTIEVEALSTPQATKRARGKAANTLVQTIEASDGSRSEAEHITEEMEETRNSSHPEEKEANAASNRGHPRRRGKASEKQDAVAIVATVLTGDVKASEQQETVTAETTTKRGRARGRGRIASVDQESKDIATLEEEEKPTKAMTGRGRGTRTRKGKALESIVGETESQEEQQEAVRIESSLAVEGALNKEDLASVGVAVSGDSQKMDIELDEEEDKPLAEMTVKPVKRTAAARRSVGSTDSPVVKRSRRKAVAEVAVAHVTSDMEDATAIKAATGRRGRKVVRFEPADRVTANTTTTTASTSAAMVTEESTVATDTEVTVVPPKRATRTRRK